jgi:fructose-1,6-bisphosphatase/inositol monophosphatase family enzyme
LLPGSVVVAEEAVFRDPTLLDLLRQPAPVWLIDPIGGTKTFLRGEAGFGIYVSLLQGGRVLAGWVHEPVSGETSYAAAGEGAWQDGRRLTVAPAADIAAMRCYVHPNVQARETGARAFAGIVRLGSVGAAFRALAAGRVHVGVFASMWPWDHAPGVLIHREAGGYAARRDGVPYSAIERFDGLLAAPDEESWQRVRACLDGNCRSVCE